MNANGLIVLMTKFLPQMQEEIRKNKREKKKCKNEYEMFDCCYVKTKKNSYLKSTVLTSPFLCGGLKTLRLTNNRLVKMERR